MSSQPDQDDVYTSTDLLYDALDKLGWMPDAPREELDAKLAEVAKQLAAFWWTRFVNHRRDDWSPRGRR